MESNARTSSSLSPMSIPQGGPVGGDIQHPDTMSGPMTSPAAAASSGESLPAVTRALEVPSAQKEPLSQDALGRLAHGTAERLQRAAATVRERSERLVPGAVSQKMVASTAEAIDQAAHYIDQTSARGIQSAVISQIRKHPWVSIGLGMTVGVWLGRALKR